jgi:hypothetical protein
MCFVFAALAPVRLGAEARFRRGSDFWMRVNSGAIAQPIDG